MRELLQAETSQVGCLRVVRHSTRNRTGTKLAKPNSRQLVKEEINRRDASVTNNDEVCPSVSRSFTKSPRHPLYSPAIPQFFWFANWLIPKLRVGSLDFPSDAVDLVATPINTLGLIERTILGE